MNPSTPGPILLALFLHSPYHDYTNRDSDVFRCDYYSGLKCFCIRLAKKMFPFGVHQIKLGLEVMTMMILTIMIMIMKGGVRGVSDHEGELLLSPEEDEHHPCQPRLFC